MFTSDLHPYASNYLWIKTAKHCIWCSWWESKDLHKQRKHSPLHCACVLINLKLRFYTFQVIQSNHHFPDCFPIFNGRKCKPGLLSTRNYLCEIYYTIRTIATISYNSHVFNLYIPTLGKFRNNPKLETWKILFVQSLTRSFIQIDQ